MPSWEEMCQQVVVAGRPGDVATAASLWEQLLKNVTAVKESLETNVKDLGEVWKGEAYEAFKTHITTIATNAGKVVEDAEGQDGIVQSLRSAADRLSAAQAAFPIPASCVNDILEARNGRLVIDTGLFEMRVKPDFLGLLDPLTSLADWINDKSGEAAQVYGDVSGQYLAIDERTPGSVTPQTTMRPDMQTPNLDGGPDPGGIGGAPKTGGMPSPGDFRGGQPPVSTADVPGTRTPTIESAAHPDLKGGYDPGAGYTPGGYPGTGSLADDYGSGLAGAGTTTAPGLGGGGLPGTGGLGAGGGGGAGLSGGGVIPGGGSLGRPVTPGIAPMMGGGAAGAGRGGGRGAGGRLGAGGKLGAGAGMVPMMGGGAAGAGRGGGARTGRGVPGVGAAGVGGAAGRGVGARGGAAGVAGMGSTGGAGYGDEELPRNTWLEEDEDVWGADGGGAPGVLR